jgi:hypothetical protein
MKTGTVGVPRVNSSPDSARLTAGDLIEEIAGVEERDREACGDDQRRFAEIRR